MKDWHELLPTIAEIYGRHGAGCCWHIVLDDQNTNRDSLDFSAKLAIEKNCTGCIAATPILLSASTTQLRKAIDGRRR